MPLSPEDVQNKRFTVVRFKFGYDEEEVDNFLDEIEEELRRLISENRTLHQTATRAPGAPSPTAVLPPAAPLQATPPQALPQPVAPPPPVQPPPPVPAVPTAIPVLAGLSGLGDTDDPTLRTLMLAQRTAEDAIAKAHADAEEILGGARAKATALEQELRAVHATRLAALEKERSGLVEEIAALRGFEREFRTRLRSYLQSTIGDLDARPSVAPTPAQPVAAAEAQSVGRHSVPLPTAAGAQPTAAGAQPTAAGAQPTAAGAQPTAAGAQPTAPGAQPTAPGGPPAPAAPTPASPPAPQPPQSRPAPQPAQPAQPTQPPAALPPVPPVAPPASPPAPPANPFSSAPPPSGPPAQA